VITHDLPALRLIHVGTLRSGAPVPRPWPAGQAVPGAASQGQAFQPKGAFTPTQRLTRTFDCRKLALPEVNLVLRQVTGATREGDALVVFMIRRLVQSVAVLFLVTIATFVLLRLIPGNPAIAVMGPAAYRNPAAIAQFDRVYGFDKPWYGQYWLWLSHLLRFNLGYSWKLNQSVASLLGNHLPKTVFLVGISIILALILAVPIGVVQAVRRNKIVDHFFNGFSTVFYAMPAFLLGILLILIFAVKFPIFPPEGPQGEGVAVLFTDFSALVLPIVTLTLITIALFSRYMRSSVLDNLTEDYVRTAKAKGASQRRILLSHVLRNSLIPIATLLGLLLPTVFAGALIIESVFNYPGMGYLFYQSALNQDYPVLLGITFVVAIATVVGSFLADIAYAVLDPRVRYVSQ
jgi:peptide/nickel transport system permease protein